MIDPSVKLNQVQAEKLCKQTEDLYPYHPTVYKLKERLLTSNGNCDPSKVENLLNGMYCKFKKSINNIVRFYSDKIKFYYLFNFLAEISNRPDDMNLRIKQLKLFENSGRLSEAYLYAINIEKSSKFQKDNFEWYDAVSQICEVSFINYM